MRTDVSSKLQSSKSGEPPKLDLSYYTDPDCSWSWALEPVIKKIRAEYGGQLSLAYKMGGFQDKWVDFFDAVNQAGHPEQVAPHWASVAKRSGMPVDERIWFEDPPISTYPGCIAYKAAVFQDDKQAEHYLRKLREAVLTERRNIAHQNILFNLAEETGLDIDRFREDYLTGPAQGAFYEDMEESRGRGIISCPTIVVRNSLGQEKTLIGYRPYREYKKVIEGLATTPLLKVSLLSIGDFVRESYCVATQEVAFVYEMATGKALIELEKLCVDGQVLKEEKAGGEFWRSKMTS